MPKRVTGLTRRQLFVRGAKLNTSAPIMPAYPANNERLDSWKEIAGYLRRAVRTVQLWEKNEELPVHRHVHKALASVYAYRSEVDTWWNCQHSEFQPLSKRISVVVLPLEAESDEPNEVSLANELRNQIITCLTRISATKMAVVAPATAKTRKNSAELVDKTISELGITHIVEGIVRFEKECVFVTVRLISASDRTYMWAQSYVGETEIGPQVAQSVVDRLFLRRRAPVGKVSLRTSAQHTSAQQSYLKGRFYWNQRTPEAFKKGILLFEQALHEDPTYALAYIGLADSYAQMGFYGILPTKAAMIKAKSLIMKALELDPKLGEAYVSLADVMTYYEWDWSGAETNYKRAIELNPNYATAYHWYADYLALMGRFDEAIENCRWALSLDPVSPIINVWLGMKYYLAGRYKEALDQYGKTLEMHPDYVLAHWALGLTYEQQMKYDQAIAEKKKALSLSSNNPLMIAGLGYSYALAGKREAAMAIVDRLTTLTQERSVLSYELATIYAALHKADHVALLLQSAYENHSQWIPFLNVEPRLRSLRADARLKNLITRCGIPQWQGPEELQRGHC